MTINNKIKCVFLDFGGVLYQIDHAASIIAFSKLSANPNFLKEVKPSSAAKEIFDYESGKIDLPEFRLKISEKFDLNCDDDAFDAAWNKILVKKFDYSAKAVKIIKEKGCKVFLLSNTNDVHFTKFAPECEEFFSLMDGFVLSYKVGSVKPEEKIYQEALKIAGFTAENCLFADDLPENLETAKGLGFYVKLISDDYTSLNLAEEL
eukprot:TRINITY_DN10544_c0_g1_i1.p2 TRINITY_DN10544_c0_g1~~TRINITY_DN10544_c0_g1_i1.p2  ORF type:complete len:206 (-),score=0.40 TRINITY_DN10544_c0_g1_i1:1337-1954(-)